MAPKWNKIKKEEVKKIEQIEPFAESDLGHVSSLRDAVHLCMDEIGITSHAGDEMKDLVQHMMILKKEQEEFAPRDWNKHPKSPRGGGTSSPKVGMPEEPQEKKEGRQKGWNQAPKKQADDETGKTDEAEAGPTAKASPRAKGWQSKKQQASDNNTDTPGEPNGTVSASPRPKAKAWGKKKNDEAQAKEEEATIENPEESSTGGQKAKGWQKSKKQELATQETPTLAAPDDGASQAGAKAKAKAKWSKGEKKNDADTTSEASKVPPLKLLGLQGTDDIVEPSSPKVEGADSTAEGDLTRLGWETIVVTPPTNQTTLSPPSAPLPDSPHTQEAENIRPSGVSRRTANTYEYEVLLNTTFEKCIARGKWDSSPWKVDRLGAPTIGDKRFLVQELPGLGKVTGVEVCTGYNCTDQEYMHSYALIESSVFACTPLLGTLHMTKVADIPNQVIIKFRATWDNGELTVDKEDYFKKIVDSFGDETKPLTVEDGDRNELQSLDDSSTRMSWSARLKAAAQEVGASVADGLSGQDPTQQPDLGLSDLGNLLSTSQAMDISLLASPAQKRWADLRTMIKLERSNFYDSVIRSDLTDVLQSIDEDELCEWRSYTRPPLLVEHVLANVQCLLGLPEDWDSIRRNMRPISGYLQQLLDFQYTSITLRDLQQMRRRAKRYPASFKPNIVETISFACAHLCRWVNVMCWRAGEQNWFHEDVELLAELDKEMISELASFIRPPGIVVAVLGNVHALLGLDESWPKIQSHLKSASNFLQRLQYFDQTTLTQDVKEILQERYMLYPQSFVPEVVQPVNSVCAKFCKWVNAVCLRAGLDFTSERMIDHRGKFGQSTFSTGVVGAAVRDVTPDSRFAHEESSGWIECIHPDSKFIRPEDHTKTLEQMFTPKQGFGTTSPSHLQIGAAKWFLDPSGQRNFRYAQPASERFGGRARSAPAIDNLRARSPLSGNRGITNRQSRSPSTRVSSLSPRHQGGAPSVSPRPRGQAQPTAGVRMQQPRQRNKETSSQPHLRMRAQHGAQTLPRNRSAPMTDFKGSPVNVKASTYSNGRCRTGSSTRNGKTRQTPVSDMSAVTSSASSSFQPFMGESSEGKHEDAHILSTLGGPAVMTTIVGVLRRPPKNQEMVASVLGNVHCLLGLDPDWDHVLESLKGFQQFLDKMKNLDQSSITPSTLEVLRQRLQKCPDSFKPDDVAATSHACSVFSKWVNAVMMRAGSPDLSATIVVQKSAQVSAEKSGVALQGGVCETEQPQKVSEFKPVDSAQERSGQTDASSAQTRKDSLAF